MSLFETQGFDLEETITALL